MVVISCREYDEYCDSGHVISHFPPLHHAAVHSAMPSLATSGGEPHQPPEPDQLASLTSCLSTCFFPPLCAAVSSQQIHPRPDREPQGCDLPGNRGRQVDTMFSFCRIRPVTITALTIAVVDRGCCLLFSHCPPEVPACISSCSVPPWC